MMEQVSVTVLTFLTKINNACSVMQKFSSSSYPETLHRAAIVFN